MTIDEAIDNLKQAQKNGVKNVIVAWWEADAFGRKDDDTWAEMCDVFDDKMDWSGTHDDIQTLIDYFERNTN
jgi:hypothetical protein